MYLYETWNECRTARGYVPLILYHLKASMAAMLIYELEVAVAPLELFHP
jgi:hypothetical protein